MDESLSVENRILLCCARCDPGALGALVDAGAPVHRSVNWEALLEAARRHGLLPLLYERLAEVGAGRVPPGVMAHLRSAYYANLLRNQRLLAELAEVVDALRGEGIEAIVLKGGALAPTVYDHPAQRPMTDLDLLLRPEGMERTGTVLRSLGFELSDAIPAEQVPFQQRFGGRLEWQQSRRGGVTRLDVQNYLVGTDWCRIAFPVESEALWAAARPLALAGVQALQLSAEDTLIHLALHPALHHGYTTPLLDYADLDRVITAKGTPLSWSRLIERAERFRVKTAVYWSLRGAQHLLGTPMPPTVQASLEPGGLQVRILRWLAPMEPGAVLHRVQGQPRGAQRVLLDAALADQIGAVGSMVLGLLFPGEEWLSARYALETRGQARLYRLVHPLRVARASLQHL